VTAPAPLTIEIGPERFSLRRADWGTNERLEALPAWLGFYRWLARRRPAEAYRREDVALIENAMRGAGMPVPPEPRITK
jgi:hypothetical protein